jgi:membrane associated rhomboid family serine protease
MASREPILNLPPMTKALLVINVAVHVLLFLLPPRLGDAVLLSFGFVPIRYMSLGWQSWRALISPITYQFLHGGLAHLGINMLTLAAFGSGVERRLGPSRMLAFYLLCGIAGAFAQFAADPESPRLLIGASGAISGLFAAILWFTVRRQGFWLVVALWFLMNVVTGEIDPIGGGSGHVAWIAHLGGFVAGLLLFPVFDRRAGAST